MSTAAAKKIEPEPIARREPIDPYDAPFDDEPYTPEEQAAVSEALAELAAGAKPIPAAEVRRRLGL